MCAASTYDCVNVFSMGFFLFFVFFICVLFYLFIEVRAVLCLFKERSFKINFILVLFFVLCVCFCFVL